MRDDRGMLQGWQNKIQLYITSYKDKNNIIASLQQCICQKTNNVKLQLLQTECLHSSQMCVNSGL